VIESLANPKTLLIVVLDATQDSKARHEFPLDIPPQPAKERKIERLLGPVPHEITLSMIELLLVGRANQRDEYVADCHLDEDAENYEGEKPKKPIWFEFRVLVSKEEQEVVVVACEGHPEYEEHDACRIVLRKSISNTSARRQEEAHNKENPKNREHCDQDWEDGPAQSPSLKATEDQEDPYASSSSEPAELNYPAHYFAWLAQVVHQIEHGNQLQDQAGQLKNPRKGSEKSRPTLQQQIRHEQRYGMQHLDNPHDGEDYEDRLLKRQVPI